MTSSKLDRTPPSREQTNALIWTVGLATALLGVVALPRRGARTSPAELPRRGDDQAKAARKPSRLTPAPRLRRWSARRPTAADEHRSRPRSPSRAGRTSLYVPITTSARTAVADRGGRHLLHTAGDLPAVAALVSCYGSSPTPRPSTNSSQPSRHPAPRGHRDHRRPGQAAQREWQHHPRPQPDHRCRPVGLERQRRREARLRRAQPRLQ